MLEGVDVSRGSRGMISIPRETSLKETQLLEGVDFSRGILKSDFHSLVRRISQMTSNPKYLSGTGVSNKSDIHSLVRSRPLRRPNC